MKFQQQKASCGPAALAAALEMFGLIRTESELRRLAGTDHEGTEWVGLVDALEALREAPEGKDIIGVPFEDSADVACMRLLRALRSGHPVVACVSVDRPWDHYVAVVGTLGTEPNVKVLVFDPAGTEAVSAQDLDSFLLLWKGPPRERRQYAGIVV